MSKSQTDVNARCAFGNAFSSKRLARRFSNASRTTRRRRAGCRVSMTALVPGVKTRSVSGGQGGGAPATMGGGGAVPASMGGSVVVPAFTGGSDVDADMGTGVDAVALTKGNAVCVDTFIAGGAVDVVAFVSDGADELLVT